MTKRSRSVLALAASALALALLTLPAAAQLVPFGGRLVDANEVPSQAGSTGTLLSVKADVTPLFGTTQWAFYTMGPCDGFVRTGSGAISQGECWIVEAATTSTAYLGYPVHLPSGASMQYTRAFFYENDVSVKPSMGFYKVDHVTGVATLIQNMDPPGTAGGNTDPSFGPFSDTVDNYTYTYHILVALPKTATATVQLHQLMIYYKLQVSPAPATASFADVPTSHPYFQFIEALKASGITGGCGAGTNYCPADPLTRGQMAVFLAKALGLQYNN